MSGRVIDLEERSRRKREAKNGHAPSRPIPVRRPPSYPDLDADLLVMSSQHHRATDLPATAEGRIAISVRGDDTWEVAVTRINDDHNLVLRGNRISSTPVTLREIVCWLFGVPA